MASKKEPKRKSARNRAQEEDREEEEETVAESPKKSPDKVGFAASVARWQIQGDTSGCDKPPVDIKTKVPFLTD